VGTGRRCDHRQVVVIPVRPDFLGRRQDACLGKIVTRFRLAFGVGGDDGFDAESWRGRDQGSVKHPPGEAVPDDCDAEIVDACVLGET
jgi:hypothetical protein